MLDATPTAYEPRTATGPTPDAGYLAALKRATRAADTTVAAIAEAFPRGAGLALATPAQLERLGCTPAQCERLRAAFDLARAADRAQSTYRAACTRPEYVAAVLRARSDVCDLEQEAFFAIALDSRVRVIDVWEISRGSASHVDVHPREIFAPLIRARAHSLIVAHNHPSGDCEPSNADRSLTERVAEAGRLLGIPLLDHVIIARTAHCSMAVLGLVPSHGLKDSVR